MLSMSRSVAVIVLTVSTLGSVQNVFAIGNPASQNCTKLGGKLSIVNTPQGQVGYCTLPSGTRCEEWALFRGECKDKAVQPERGPIVGGYRVANTRDRYVQNAAQFAAKQVSKNKSNLKGVLKAETQVVAGNNYRMLIELSNGQRYQVVVYSDLNRKYRLMEAKKVK